MTMRLQPWMRPRSVRRSLSAVGEVSLQATRSRLVSAAALAAILAVAIPPSIGAMGLGVIPGRLDFHVRPGGTETQTLHVVNQSDAPSHFEVYVEGEWTDWFAVAPGEFILHGGEVKAVEIALATPLTAKLQEYEATVCVVTLQPDSDLRLGAGIRIPARARVTVLGLSATTVRWWLAGALATAGLTIAIVVAFKRRHHRACAGT